jgi:hypothetical protein
VISRAPGNFIQNYCWKSHGKLLSPNKKIGCLENHTIDLSEFQFIRNFQIPFWDVSPEGKGLG